MKTLSCVVTYFTLSYAFAIDNGLARTPQMGFNVSYAVGWLELQSVVHHMLLSELESLCM
jgi:hypothetical protein